jgi:hypothetical protein
VQSLLTLVLTFLSVICSFCQAAPDSVIVRGVIEDQTDGAVPNATVELSRTDGYEKWVVVTDNTGTFRFENILPGSYLITVRHDGFETKTVHLDSGDQFAGMLKIVLPVSELHQELTVSSGRVQLDVADTENQEKIELTDRLLQDLPLFNENYLAAVSSFLDPSSIGNTGPSIVVDGLETPEVGVSPSAIQEVKVNQNPYSAEYSRPGRGRIEIITRPGSSEFHGTFNFVFRDYVFNARNAFALTNPQEQHRTFEGNLSGPLGRGRKTSFLISASRSEEDVTSIVFADTPSGITRTIAFSPQRNTLLSVRLNHQVSGTHSLSVRYELMDQSSTNQGVGGTNLMETATDARDRQDHIYYTDHSAFSAALNDFSVRAGRHYDPIESEFPRPKIVVLDSFSGGGAQADKLTTENHVQFDDILTWAHGKHTIKAGVNAPDLGQRGLDDRSNRTGTYYFSSLPSYLESKPFLFTIQRGDGHIAFWEAVMGGFIQDNIRVTPTLAVTAGLRYDWQNYASDYHNVSPRIALAWAPHNSRKIVVRVGGGVFYDRTGPNAIADTLRYDGQHLQSYVSEDPTFPESFGGDDLLPGIVRFQRNLKIPYTIQYSAGVERQLHKGTTLSATYIGIRGVDLFRSRDINSPLPPLYLVRPNSSLGVEREIESAGALKSEAMEVGLRVNITSIFDGAAQYRLSRTHDNTGGISAFPANNWDLSGEWSRADTDARHRLNLLGSLHATRYFTVGVNLSVHSGTPYSLTTGLDEYHDGIPNSRPPGVPRNSLQGPGYVNLDVRWSRDFLLKRTGKDAPKITLAIDGFNLLNHTNYVAFIGNIRSPFFGRAVESLPARQLQLSFRLKF